MTKQSTYYKWLLTNLLGGITIILIIFVLNLILVQIEFDLRRLAQVAIGIFIFFVFGIVVTFPHLIYVQVIIRKEYEQNVLWEKVWKSMAILYGMLITVVVLINSLVYGNPVYELPNLMLLGILIVHFCLGILIWKTKQNTQ
jgi:hypothetical protein